MTIFTTRYNKIKSGNPAAKCYSTGKQAHKYTEEYHHPPFSLGLQDSKIEMTMKVKGFEFVQGNEKSIQVPQKIL